MEKGKSWFGFFFFWMLVNIVGWLAFGISDFYVVLFAVGLLIAWLQFLVLKRYFALDDLAWIWLSFALYGASYALLLSVKQFGVGLIFIGTAVLFGLIGYVQWRSLFFCLRNARLWLIATPLAGCVSLFVAIMSLRLHLNLLVKETFNIALGCTYGVITGIAILIADKLPMKKVNTTPE